MKNNKIVCLAALFICASTNYTQAEKPKHNPNGPEFNVKLPPFDDDPEKKPITLAIDADLLSPQGKNTVAFTTQFDKDLAPFLLANGEIDDETRIKIDDMRDLEQRLRQYLDGLNEQEKQKFTFAVRYLVAKEILAEQKIVRILENDYARKKQLIQQINLISNKPASTNEEDIKIITDHIKTHYKEQENKDRVDNIEKIHVPRCKEILEPL